MNDHEPPIEANAVVLPPDKFGKARIGEDAKNASEASRIVAQWMDELIRVPGTNIRIGLDPILGLFPGIGDFLASSIGVVTLTEGVRRRVPLLVLVRMGLNVLINDAVGTIPGIGDVFSMWFKSNSRNLQLINQWQAGEEMAVRRGSRLFLVVFFCVWLGLLLVWLGLWLTVAGTVWHFVSKLFFA
ncbi:MAG: DUF4112 domain-containing protein [Roseimicrobium sp.]